jgi:hypothetical protein
MTHCLAATQPKPQSSLTDPHQQQHQQQQQQPEMTSPSSAAAMSHPWVTTAVTAKAAAF